MKPIDDWVENKDRTHNSDSWHLHESSERQIGP